MNSQPGALLRDGTICITDNDQSLRCNPMVKIGSSVIKTEAGEGFFDGIFDLDDSGSPEVFIDYWPSRDDPNCPARYRDEDDPACNGIALLVYKKINGNYRQLATLNAPSEGYSPGAWFIKDSPLPKAIFQTRYGGSSGNGLFYLNWKKRSLELITDDFYMLRSPVYEGVEVDGNSEIFITARGYDRTADQGAALLHWKDNTYKVWWPTWAAPPYVMSAQLVTIGKDRTESIVAVLDQKGAVIDSAGPGARRALTVWVLVDNSWKLIDEKEIAGVADAGLMAAFPELSSVTPTAEGATIALTYRDGSVLTCQYAKPKITCLPQARPHTD